MLSRSASVISRGTGKCGRCKNIATRKRQWNLKAVPAFQQDFQLQMIGHRHDWQAGDLRQRHGAFLHHIARAARAVRGDGQVVTFFCPGSQFQQRLRAAPAAEPRTGCTPKRSRIAARNAPSLLALTIAASPGLVAFCVRR